MQQAPPRGSNLDAVPEAASEAAPSQIAAHRLDAAGQRHSRLSSSRTFSSLANPDFRLLWIGLLFSQGAMQVNLIARSWLAFDVSGSAAVLGIVAVAQAIPMGVFSLAGGALADRFDKRKILVATQGALALLAVVTAVLVHLDVVVVWHLVVVGLLQGASFSFAMPARQALIPLLVSDDDVTNAIAMNSTGLNFTRVIGPAVAGVLMAVHPALAFDSIAVLYCLAALMLLRLPTEVKAVDANRSSAVQDVLDGFRYVRQNAMVRGLLILAFIPILLGMPFTQFLPVFQKEVLHVDALYLGLMFTAVGVGSLAGSLAVARVSDISKLPRLQLIAGVGFGLSLLAFACSTSLWLSFGLLALVGLASQGYLTMNNVLLLRHTERHYFGRVMSIYLITFSVMPLAVLPMGLFIDAFGGPITQAVAGALLAVFILAWAFSKRLFVSHEAAPAHTARATADLEHEAGAG